MRDRLVGEPPVEVPVVLAHRKVKQSHICAAGEVDDIVPFRDSVSPMRQRQMDTRCPTAGRRLVPVAAAIYWTDIGKITRKPTPARAFGASRAKFGRGLNRLFEREARHEVSAKQRPEQRSAGVKAPRFAGREAGAFRRVVRNPCGACRESAKNAAASARNLWASRAASPGPPKRRTGVPVEMDASVPPAPVLKAKSVARSSALHNRKSNRQRTGAERRTRLSAMAESVIRMTASRRSAS